MSKKYNTDIFFQVHSKPGLLIIWVVLVLSSHGLAGQGITMNLYPDSILIGQRSSVTIQLDLPVGTQVIWPTIYDSLARNIEVVHFGNIDTTYIGSNQLSISQQLEVTSFEAGFHAIPPLLFMLVNNGDSLLIESEPLLLQVQGVEVPQEATPYDIKPIFRMPVGLLEVLRILIPALLLGGAIALLILWLRKILKKKPVKESVWDNPEIPAHVAAISSLEGLKSKNLWQNGKHKLYHIELTFILRMYLEKRFGLLALEMTSGEIISHFPEYIHDTGLLTSIKVILETGDLVKFAKFIPDDHENEDCLARALEFVWRTVPPKTDDDKSTA